MKRKLMSLFLCLCMLLSFEGIALAKEKDVTKYDSAEVVVDGNIYYLTCENKVTTIKVGTTFEANNFMVVNSAGNRCPEIEEAVTVNSKVNNKVPGMYKVEYELEGTSVAHAVSVVRELTSETSKKEATEYGELQLVPNGKELEKHILGQDFEDKGAKLVNSDGKVIYDLKSEITVIGRVDVNKAGLYTLTYMYEDMTVTRIVNVCQVESILKGHLFIFELEGLSEMEIEKGSEFEEPGFYVKNTIGNRYPKIEEQVLITGEVNTEKVGDYVITYKLGNVSVTRVVHVVESIEQEEENEEKKTVLEEEEDTSLKLLLLSDETVKVKKGETFKDCGAWVVDEDETLQVSKLSEITVDGHVNTSKIGKYILTYKYENMTVMRTVYVIGENQTEENRDDSSYADTDSSNDNTGDSGDSNIPEGPGDTGGDDEQGKPGDSGNNGNGGDKEPNEPSNPTPPTPSDPEPSDPKPSDPTPSEPDPTPPTPPTPMDPGMQGPGSGTSQLPGGLTEPTP